MASRKTPKPSQLLRDMRLVYKQEKKLDVTPGQKAIRKLFEEDPARFMATLARLESEHKGRLKDHKAAREARAAAQGEKMPEKEGAIVGLIDQLLDEWHGEQ